MPFSVSKSYPPASSTEIPLHYRGSGSATDGGAVVDGQDKAEEEEDIDPEAEASEEEDDEEEPHEEASRLDRHATPKSGPQLSSISRLKASTSSSRSSSTSSPSILSATSSTSQLTTPSSVASVNPSPPSYASRVSVTKSYPLFVTWNTISRSGHKSLRGCIGTFDAMPLESGLASYSLTSAFDDTRFSPIPASLLPALSCSLTLLADFEPCKDAMDWTLGVHGLRISFTNRGRRHGATYLPDVAVEQGWTKEETLESLMKKAGWDGGYGHGVARRLLRGSARGPENQSTKPWDDVQDFRVVRYTGLKASASYNEWQEWRRWVEKSGETLRR
ncbi:hypothetical protein LTR10_023806 [Elasticomyces elasticus]|uniref:AMMECR1 domain-containing protein n=1 Tax=Exophiala sideris TaxID=1016849 RepID=A0ABR0J7V2_9EURO|nr:hypothetical protein LTR10_023806 [Elasticomyces elasticus]KAK5028690.1 hypothetical protein LTS07_006069 [Exophiala sideris]KAK5035558.1 hypothetical protein LTR13_005687 [Exophiala sideris]KAK5057194.1 hypothetical protein LTR69_007233 [Exophiala sideris]KAK5181833.1 hypothetical protein LTR44_006033 [Eurotiomycetes sp. CCFEE 6388]